MSVNEELPFVSVIIPTLNTVKTVKMAIEAVLEQKYPKDKMEVIVVDGGSTDGTREVLLQYPVKLIQQEKDYPGDSGARNIGALNAIGDFIATTDADDEVDQNWLIHLISYSEPNIGAVVGRSHIAYDKENWQERIVSELFICLRGSDKVENIYNKKARLKTNISVGPNQSFRKDVFNKIGGYDMGLSSGMDLDIIWRVEKKGYKVAFAPDAIVYKKSRSNFMDFLKQTYIRGKEGVSIYFKHPSKITFRYLFNMLYFPLITAISIFGFLFNIELFMYLVMIVLVLPTGYYLIRISKGLRYIKKTVDIIFILIIGYISFIISSIGILSGCFDYIVNYEEKLMDKEG